MSGDRFDDRTEFRDSAGAASSQPHVRFAAGDVVASRFRIVAPLGRGGMGEVYRADDMKLGQSVALKFLPADAVARDGMLERLIAEVRIGRQVAHRNVCRLYDIGETEQGAPFIAMELVDGEDLASLLRRIGRLPSDKALALAHDILSGLAAAHDAGVIHRDLKPANVMIDSAGRARITDFGLAVIRAEGAASGFAGTPAYMAPEQLAGSSATVRSDLYAAGLVLFEMTTGRRLFDGGSLEEVRRMHSDPKPLPSALVHDVDPSLEEVIGEALQEAPQKRPSSAQSMLARLPLSPRPSSAPYRISPHDSSGSGAAERRSIAVVPFEHVGADEEDEYFAIGLADEIISDLSKIGSLRVISRGSVMRYKGARDIPSVARDLQVAFVLTGSIRRIGSQLRVTANVIEGATDSVVWSEKFRGTLDDVFDIQEAVAREVASQLHVKLSAEEEEKLTARPIPNALAYEYYLKARAEIWKFSRAALDDAVELLQRGLDIVGENALLLAAMGYAEWQYFNSGVDPDEKRLMCAGELAMRALALEPGSPSAHRVLGLKGISAGDPRTAIVELRRSVEGEPHDTDAAWWLVWVYMMSNFAEEAEALMSRLLAIDPFNPFGIMGVPYAKIIAGEFEEAAEEAKKRAPGFIDNGAVIFVHSYAYIYAGRTEEASAVLERVPETLRDDFFYRLARFVVLAAGGEREAALSVADAAFRAAANADLQYSFTVAEGFALLGDGDEALDWLENAIARGYVAWPHFVRSPLLASVRETPRFRQLVDRARAAADDLRRAIAHDSRR